MKQKAIELATSWRESSKKYLTPVNQQYTIRMNLLFQNSHDKETLIRIIDRCFRSKDTKTIIEFIVYTFKTRNIPKFFNIWEKTGIYIMIITAKLLHTICAPLFKFYTIHSVSNYMIFGDINKVIKKIKQNDKHKIKTNINHLGELLLGEEEALQRIKSYISDLANPDIKCISIKISTIYSQIFSISFDQTVEVLKERLITILRVAKNNKYQDEKGIWHYKLVNFDMEEYRDMPLTVDLFIKTLSEFEFKDLMVGIALQAYLPDSYDAQKKITEWAKKRVARGGAPVRIRIVKGANMESERFESSEKNLSLAPFNQKYLTDANHKRMIIYGLKKENSQAVNIGVASHNLFDIAFAYLIAQENNSLDYCRFEMLQGMCDHVMKYLANDIGLNVLAYLPFSGKDEFASTIGYLIRRFDENTSPDNYLRYVNNLNDYDNVWQILKEKFILSIESIPLLENVKTYRTQNRLQEVIVPKSYYKFAQEADTDFTLPVNVEWAENIKKKWQKGNDFTKQILLENTKNDIDNIIDIAKNDNSWVNIDHKKRLEILINVAKLLAERRGDFIGIAAFETGKIFSEADAEISEAIDFANYYTYSFNKIKEEFDHKLFISAKGLGLIASPWNFPIAIAAGGILSALATGNNVIFKPSNLSVLTGLMLAECFWDAGVPKSALHFVNASGEMAKYLTAHNKIDFINFTGSTQTALDIIKNRPKVNITAETGGKNVTIATKYSDRDQVIKNVIQSAFSNAGQKCSATSILILHSELYNDKQFLANLVDATKSLKVGDPWDFSVKISPLIRTPNKDLLWALTQLEPEEQWLLSPKQISDKMWSPGIKIGVKFGSKTHFTEFFGPVLAIMKFETLDEAIKIANASGYGLTSGLESLDEREQKIWCDKIKAGNLYINRSTTGAMVMRQPFGGMGKSSLGAGIKAGGLNYVTQFVNFENKQIENTDISDIVLPEADFVNSITDQQFSKIAKNYLREYYDYFSKSYDYANILGQSNLCLFIKTNSMIIRVHKNDDQISILTRLFAAKLCVVKIAVSVDDACGEMIHNLISQYSFLFENVKVIIENDEFFSKTLVFYNRLRYSNQDVPEIVLKSANELGIYIARNPILYYGKIELLQYLQEQSISFNYHRYGHIDKT